MLDVAPRHDPQEATRCARLELRPQDLEVDDFVFLDGSWAEVVGEPLSMHSGWSLFDELELTIGVAVAEPHARGRRGYVKLAAGDTLQVCRPQNRWSGSDGAIRAHGELNQVGG